ncbi:MAG: D-Ala-D-Ala carboxypeptidase family metallohydrolase [Eubacteriales bacterium]|nr:D-Ala-D-Ala carboxypeptidase family metallohydrolase [Eubacteriales bacterium]
MTIEQIQHLLAYLGRYTAPVDGAWGPQSRQAAVEFQKSAGLDPDGIPGKQTQAALRQAVAREDGEDFWDTVPNFAPSEFACPCCGLNNVDHTLVRVCQRLRTHFDAPFQVSSGPRCPRHNAEVGGVPNSKHLTGRAVDFRIPGHPAAQLLPQAQAQPEIRYAYAIDNQFVHMELA